MTTIKQLTLGVLAFAAMYALTMGGAWVYHHWALIVDWTMTILKWTGITLAVLTGFWIWGRLNAGGSSSAGSNDASDDEDEQERPARKMHQGADYVTYQPQVMRFNGPFCSVGPSSVVLGQAIKTLQWNYERTPNVTAGRVVEVHRNGTKIGSTVYSM